MSATSARLSTSTLYGRHAEQKILQESYRRAVDRQRPELVLLSGPAGTGKSSLANATLKQFDKAIFVTGKFLEQTSLSPDGMASEELYPVFSAAIMDYVEQLLVHKDVNEEALCSAAQLAVGDDLDVALTSMPGLNLLLRYHGPKRRPKVCCFGSEGQERFQTLFSRLIRALTTFLPLILFFDDVQFADNASMELLRAVLLFGGIRRSMRCLVVTAHECEDTTRSPHGHQDGHINIHRHSICPSCIRLRPFQWCLGDLRNTDDVPIVTIKLGELTSEDLRDMICGLLRKSDDEASDDLATLIFRQTEGKLIDVMQILRLLFDQGFLAHDEQHGWLWNPEEVKENFGSLEAVQAVVCQAIAKLSRMAQECLKVASILGDEIDDSALDLCLQTTTGYFLEEAASAGLLVFFAEYGGYRFAHDWVRQAAYDLVPEEERDEFHLKVGRKLWKSSPRAAVDRNIFVVVSLLNKGARLINEEREVIKIAEMNLTAGEKAVAMSSTVDASRFFRKGLHLLGANKWADHYALTLGLYSSAAEAEVVNGQYERVVLYIDEVVHNAKCLADKLRAYIALIRSMGQQDNMMEAAEVGLDVLRQMGERIPTPTKMSVSTLLFRTKMAFQRRSDVDILRLAPMTDPSKIVEGQILNVVFACSYQARSPYAPLVSLKSVLLTLEHGRHKHSAVAFAIFGMLLCSKGGNKKDGFRCGQLAVALAEKMQVRGELAKVHFFCGHGITHWTRPIKESIDQLTYGQRVAMEVGEKELSILTLVQKAISSVFSGVSLYAVSKEVEEGLSLARLYRKHSIELGLLLLLQLIECYTGRAANPERLSGSMIKFESLMMECLESKNMSWAAMMYFFGLELAYMFGDYDYAFTMSEGIRKIDESGSSAQFLRVEKMYKRGLTAVALLRKNTEYRKNLAFVKDVKQQLAGWSKDSPRSYRQKLLLLEAELLSARRSTNVKKIVSLYDEALDIAKREGYTNEAALIQERTGDYLFYCCKDLAAAHDRWEFASACYEQWGAVAKAEQLRCHASGTNPADKSVKDKDTNGSETSIFVPEERGEGGLIAICYRE